MQTNSQCRCAPINSLLTYFYPSYGADSRWHYDGYGDTSLNVTEGLLLAMSKSSNAYSYTDGRISASFHESTLLRSEIQFGAPLAGMYSTPTKYSFDHFILFVGIAYYMIEFLLSSNESMT